MKKVTVIIFVLIVLLLLPAAFFAFAPQEIAAVLDKPIFSPYIFVCSHFITLLYSLLGLVYWASGTVVFTAVCLYIAHRRKELTPLYGCTMIVLCIAAVVCHIGAPDYAAFLMNS